VFGAGWCCCSGGISFYSWAEAVEPAILFLPCLYHYWRCCLFSDGEACATCSSTVTCLLLHCLPSVGQSDESEGGLGIRRALGLGRRATYSVLLFFVRVEA
jgi:hypothetical protein